MKWKGFSEDQNTWEPKESFATPLLVQAFENSVSKPKQAKKKDFEFNSYQLPNRIAHTFADPGNSRTDVSPGKILS